MLPPDLNVRQKAFDLIIEVLSARGELSAEDLTRIQRIGELFGVKERTAKLASSPVISMAGRKENQSRAS